MVFILISHIGTIKYSALDTPVIAESCSLQYILICLHCVPLVAFHLCFHIHTWKSCSSLSFPFLAMIIWTNIFNCFCIHKCDYYGKLSPLYGCLLMFVIGTYVQLCVYIYKFMSVCVILKCLGLFQFLEPWKPLICQLYQITALILTRAHDWFCWYPLILDHYGLIAENCLG